MTTWTNFVAFGETGFVWLLTWSWQSLLLLGGVWLGLKLWRAKLPALRHQVWLIALVTVGLLPLLGVVARKLPLIQPNNRAFGYVMTIPRVVEAVAPTNAPTPASQSQRVASASAPSKAFLDWASVRAFSWRTIFLSWIVGVGFALIRLWRQLASLRKLRANARPISPTELNCDDCSPALLATNASLGLSAEITSPILIGLWRPMILLPTDICDWATVEERRAMLRHELAHVERRDHWTNLLPTLLNTVFFFHPMVRYACRQLGLERELACDDRVVTLGVTAETYAESILKVAQRSLAPNVSKRWTPSGAHQLALFSAKHILERRIEMILNKDRARTIARQWKSLLLPVAMIAVVAWLLIAASSAKPGLAQPNINSAESKLQQVKSLGDNKDYNGLIEMALRTPDAELRRLAAIQVTELEGDGSTDAMVDLYWQTNDPEVQQMIIETFARIGEIEPLTKIALSDPSVELRERALSRVKWLKETSESADIRGWYVPELQRELNKLQGQPPAPPPPPPPPPPTQQMTVEAGKPLNTLRWHQDKNSVFTLLRGAVDAQIRRDTSFFERVLDEDYIETGPSGETLNKAQAIADIKRMDYTITKFEFDDLSVSSNGPMAFATFLGTVYFQTNGQDSTTQYRYTINFIERDGQWKVAAVHMSRKQ